MIAYRLKPPQVNTETSDSLGRLSALPRELRDEIYSYLLPQGQTLFWREVKALRFVDPINRFQSDYDTEDEEESTILKNSNNALQPNDTPGSNLALLRLSKHIYEEATPLLYSQNTFGFFPSWRLAYSGPIWEPNDLRSAAIFALRRLSKHIYEEAKNLLYSHNIFGFFPSWRVNPSHRRLKPDNLPSAAIADCITNVEFHLGPEMQFLNRSADTEEDLEYCRKKNSFDSILPGPVALFTGTDIRRRSALIEIKPREWSYYITHVIPSCYITHVIPSPLFAAIGQLTGFRKVTVRLHAYAPYFCPLKGISDVEVRYCVQREDWGMVHLMEASRVRLEPTLGRGVLGELVVPPVETSHPQGWSGREWGGRKGRSLGD